jgi:hypothetical protein
MTSSITVASPSCALAFEAWETTIANRHKRMPANENNLNLTKMLLKKSDL